MNELPECYTTRVLSDIMNANSEAVRTKGPLCVDLDGTLVNGDTFAEPALRLITRNPLYAIVLIGWLFRGKCYLKNQVARAAPVDVELLPYRVEVLEYVRRQQEAGRPVVLVSAAAEETASRVAKHLDIPQVIASSNGLNLKGRAKARFLAGRYGSHGFTYVGDSRADIPVWADAAEAVCVGGSPALLSQLKRMGVPVTELGSRRPGFLRTLARELRVHQATKNTLVLAPLFLAHKLSDGTRIIGALTAFFALTLCTSAAYVINDLLDLEADRVHQEKCRRPLASGDMPLVTGALLVPVLLGAGFGLSVLVRPAFIILLAAYVGCTLLYSLRLKRLVIVDVLTLAGLYTWRLILGGYAASVRVSPWLLAFSMFMFLNIALLKRYTDLRCLRSTGVSRAHGRGYCTDDAEQIARFGTSAAYIAVLVLALYITSPEVIVFYRQPNWLWGISVLILYWNSRLWFMAERGKVSTDPVLFAVRDKMSYGICALALLFVLLATVGVSLGVL